MTGLRRWYEDMRGRSSPSSSPPPQRPPLAALPPVYAARFDPQRIDLAEVLPDEAPVWRDLGQQFLRPRDDARGACVATSLSADRLPQVARVLCEQAAAAGLQADTVDPAQRWRGPNDGVAAIATALGLQPASQTLSALTAALNEGPPRLILIPALHRAMLRAPGGAAAFITLMQLILQTRGRVGWWLGAHAPAWQRLVRWVGIDSVVSTVTAIEGLDDAALAEALWSRHAAGERGLRILSASDGRPARVVKGAADEPLRDWVRAARTQAGPDLGRLCQHWLACAGLDEDSGEIHLSMPAPPDWPALAPLPPRRRYALIEIMVHDGLRLEELAELFVCARADMVADAARLAASGLIDVVDDVLMPPRLRAARLARQLSSLQALE